MSSLDRVFKYNCLILLISYGIAMDKDKLLPDNCGVSYSHKIIGGRELSLGEYPWLARIGYVWTECVEKILYSCGGTLINDRYVLSAAHCVKMPSLFCPLTNKDSSFKVTTILLGEHNSVTDPDCDEEMCAEPVQRFTPEQIIVHPNYDDPEHAHDISLIRLNKRVMMNGFVSPVCLPHGEKQSHIAKGEMVLVAGWGTTDIKKFDGSTVPMVVKVPILEIDDCLRAYKETLVLDSKRQWCAGGVEGKDSCGGDSGGPVVHVESYGGPPRYYAIGIVSAGVVKCGKKDKPAIYTKIVNYIDWIVDNMVP